jgi:hypothetical protein
MNNLITYIPGKHPHVLYKNIQWQDEYGEKGWTCTPANHGDAQVVSSEIYDTDRHAPVLDIDVPAYLVPSSTPGHSHLYIYVKASIRRRHTAVRVPWLKK